MYISCRPLHVLHPYMLVRLMLLQRALVQAMEHQWQWRRLPVMAVMHFKFRLKDHSDEEQERQAHQCCWKYKPPPAHVHARLVLDYLTKGRSTVIWIAVLTWSKQSARRPKPEVAERDGETYERAPSYCH